MGTPSRDDVWFCLHLYEQRREPVLRQARDWFAAFNPKSFAEIQAVAEGKEGADASRFYRQATSYWEMVCALLNSGGVSPECRDLFTQTTREWLYLWAKLEPYIEQIRANYWPTAYQHLEAFARSLPDYEQALDSTRKMIARATKGAKGKGAKPRGKSKKKSR